MANRLSANMNLRWRGPAISEAVAQATIKGINETNQAVVNVARPITPVDTGLLQSSYFVQPAQRRGVYISGQVGNNAQNPRSGDFYAIFVELGTVHMSGRFMMRKAAQQEYPKLPMRIKKNLAWPL